MYSLSSYAQENKGYQTPPKDIMDLVDVKLAPNVWMDSKKEYMVLATRNAYKTIEELSQEEMRLGGLRINPKTNIGSRTTYFNDLQIRKVDDVDDPASQVKGLPTAPKLSNFVWSPDQRKMAFTHTTLTGVELWYLDLTTRRANKLTDATINANMRSVVSWFEDGNSLLVKMLAEDRKPLIDTDNSIPSGPTISVNDGKKAQNRTYQDLLKNKSDEHNFEQLAMSTLVKVDLDGNQSQWLESAMYSGVQFSPDGSHIMITTVEKPFSYLVPYRRFPSKTAVYDAQGTLVKQLIEVPLIEDLPQGFMACRTGMRSFSWRSDKAATLIYVEALDGGDPEVEVDYRDQVYQLDSPFASAGKPILKLQNRYSYIQWSGGDQAVAHDYWWNNRNTKSYLFDVNDGGMNAKVISDRSYQDRYSDPGSFVMERNAFGSYVLAVHDDHMFLLGDGYSDEGQFPFLDKMSLETQEVSRLYQSSYQDKVEDLRDYDPSKNKLMVRIESANEYPNYYFRDLDDQSLNQLSFFDNPFKSIQDIEKEVITYTREDGVELSGTLYLPLGYDKAKKEKLPMILWAYPREFKDKSSANQNTQNPNEFTYPYWGSPIYWLTRGYVILDDASFPILGEGDTQPNDSFRTQLVANAKAAIDAVDALGYIDTDRVAVGGHSYGAFMVANLLSHSDLFAAGIARSGAYNRTLTPFGFQSEERNYWEAPEVYYTMSPFMHAEKMKTPLLLIHGEADNNSGTYPMQSERYFNALKGLGAQVRLVMLPKESHGYRAKESILHMLWEQDQWLDTYVKNKQAVETKP